MNILSEEYVRGLVEGEGCFTFDSKKDKYGNIIKIPTFVVAMHERDQELLRMVRKTLNLNLNNSHSIYIYGPYSNESGSNRGKIAKLIVRDYESIKNVIIPFFYKKLYGNKGVQFEDWLKRMGENDISYQFKDIYKLYKSGFFDK